MSTIKYSQTPQAVAYKTVLSEYPSAVALNAATGAIHFALTLAAEAVLHVGAVGTEKLTNGAITKHEAKMHRIASTTQRVVNVKNKINNMHEEARKKIEAAKAKAAERAEQARVKLSDLNTQN